MIREAERRIMKARRQVIYGALCSILYAFCYLAWGSGWWLLGIAWCGVIVALHLEEYHRIDRALAHVKASPVYYLMLVQEEFGGDRS